MHRKRIWPRRIGAQPDESARDLRCDGCTVPLASCLVQHGPRARRHRLHGAQFGRGASAGVCPDTSQGSGPGVRCAEPRAGRWCCVTAPRRHLGACCAIHLGQARVFAAAGVLPPGSEDTTRQRTNAQVRKRGLPSLFGYSSAMWLGKRAAGDHTPECWLCHEPRAALWNMLLDNLDRYVDAGCTRFALQTGSKRKLGTLSPRAFSDTRPPWGIAKRWQSCIANPCRRTGGGGHCSRRSDFSVRRVVQTQHVLPTWSGFISEQCLR